MVHGSRKSSVEATFSFQHDRKRSNTVEMGPNPGVYQRYQTLDIFALRVGYIRVQWWRHCGKDCPLCILVLQFTSLKFGARIITSFGYSSLNAILLQIPGMYLYTIGGH